MNERFPAHVLLNGASSEKVYLRKDYAVWYFIPVIPGSIQAKKQSCQVTTEKESNLKKLECRYRSGFAGSERILSVPLVASKVGVFYEAGQEEPDHASWRVIGATLTGSNVYKATDEVELVCTPRSEEFGYQPLTQEDILIRSLPPSAVGKSI